MDANFLQAFFKMIGTLILIACAIFLLIYFLKRFRLKALSLKKFPEIRLVSSLHLGAKKSVAIIEVSGKWLVVGVGTETLTLLTELDSPPETEVEAEIDHDRTEKGGGRL